MANAAQARQDVIDEAVAAALVKRTDSHSTPRSWYHYHIRFRYTLHHRAKDDPVTTATLVQNPYFNTTMTMLGIICSSQMIGHRRLRNSKMCMPLQTAARENYFSFITNMGIFLSTNSRSWQRQESSQSVWINELLFIIIIPQR